MDLGRKVLFGEPGDALTPRDPALGCSSGDVPGQHPKRRGFRKEPSQGVWKQACLPALFPNPGDQKPLIVKPVFRDSAEGC